MIPGHRWKWRAKQRRGDGKARRDLITYDEATTTSRTCDEATAFGASGPGGRTHATKIRTVRCLADGTPLDKKEEA